MASSTAHSEVLILVRVIRLHLIAFNHINPYPELHPKLSSLQILKVDDLMMEPV